MTETTIRALLFLTLLGAGAAIPSSAPASADASRPAVVCSLRSVLNVGFGGWGGPGTSIKRELFAFAGSRGANREGGYVIYGSATPTRAETDRICRKSPPGADPAQTRLSKRFYYRSVPNGNTYFRAKDGEQLLGELLHQGTVDIVRIRRSHGISYSCMAGKRVTIVITDSREAGRVTGSRFDVRVGRELLATALLRQRGESFFRISNRCRTD